MKLKEYVESKRCFLEETGEDQAAIKRGEAARYEVLAPSGYCFPEGQHALLCQDAQDVRERLDSMELEECSADCDCFEEL